MISDTHFDEQPVRRRKLSGMGAEELDMLIERNWRECVGEDDIVWHLGDIGKGWRRLKSLPGRKQLILAHAPDRRSAIRTSGVFETIQETGTLEHAGRTFLLIHNPDELADGTAAAVIHGHHHYAAPAPGHYSVCVDHWGWAPVTLDALIASS